MSITPTDQILDALDFAALPQDEQAALKDELADVVTRGALIRVLEGMDEATRDAFIDLTESGASEEEIEAFLAERAPHAAQAEAETLADLANDILLGTGTNH